jgi:hypothetical protein
MPFPLTGSSVSLQGSTIPIVPGNFVVVQLKTSGNKKLMAHYIGVVLKWKEEVDLSGWEIQCMRRQHYSSINQFAFPTIDDIAIYLPSEIVVQLAKPKIVRNSVYLFSLIELQPYLLTLR